MCKARSSKGAIFGQGGNLGNTTIRLVLEAKWKWDYFDKLYLVAINGLALHFIRNFIFVAHIFRQIIVTFPHEFGNALLLFQLADISNSFLVFKAAGRDDDLDLQDCAHCHLVTKKNTIFVITIAISGALRIGRGLERRDTLSRISPIQ